jgi:Uma2 family endonuclease
MLTSAMADSLYDFVLPVPAAAKLPIELEPPPGFEPADVRTWPDVTGRLEYVDGRLLYMPPCGSEQAALAANVAHLLMRWSEERAGYLVGSNDPGLVLGKDVRAPDAAVWARPDPTVRLKREFSRTAPLLAVEVAGRDDAEDESALLRKAKWYLRHGTTTVWLVLPESREVVVLRKDATRRFGSHESLPTPPELPALTIEVAEIFSVL